MYRHDRQQGDGSRFLTNPQHEYTRRLPPQCRNPAAPRIPSVGMKTAAGGTVAATTTIARR
jgi:hypothetical protein